MTDYRPLTDEEIIALEDNGCTAEDWTNVCVVDDFRTDHIRNVSFYGEVNLGVFEKSVEVTQGFFKHSALRDATLRNVTVGDNCLIENIGNHINNYVIGDDCYISNVCVMETTAEATFGEGNNISVLNEAGSGNVMLFSSLTSNLAALMLSHTADREFVSAIRNMVKDDINRRVADIGTIGNGVKIVNSGEIINTHISDNCEVNGACRLSDCTLTSKPEDGVYIGSGVICENSIIADGSSILNSAKLNGCFVGEACQITNGFTAESSLFFANTYMSNGEACAAFCGPFSASHHKSSLLIGCMTSFYNAGSNTNFSNHAYKMGPLHYGILERGTKTASGSHLLLPATIGAFSVCLGKVVNHPDTRSLPFSYIIAEGKDTYIVPGRNISTVGLYRDITKWPRRDVRLQGSKRSAINFKWLNPLTVNEMLQGKQTLESLRDLSGDNAETYTYKGCKIKRNALLRGIELYDMAIQMFIGEMAKELNTDDTQAVRGTGEWHDLSGLLIPVAEEKSIVDGVKEGSISSVNDLLILLKDSHSLYNSHLQNYTRSLIASYCGENIITEDVLLRLIQQGNAAHEAWLSGIKADAEKEYSMGDVDKAVLDKFIEGLK